VARPLCLMVHKEDEAWQWHERHDHANFGSLEKMSKLEMVRGLPLISHTDQFCNTCVLAKHRHGAFPKQSKYRVDKTLELVHDDLCRPVKPVTPGERRYFLLLVDDATRYVWVALLVAKSKATGAIRHIQVAVEKECGCKPRVLRTDMVGSSWQPSSLPTALTRESRDTSQRHTPHSRTGWCSGRIRRWWQWHARS
jgi:hypothetical protein